MAAGSSKPAACCRVFDANWHLPLSAGSGAEEAIRLEREGLKNMAADTPMMAPYEYIDSELEPENYRVFGKAQSDFDIWRLKQLPVRTYHLERDVTKELWSEREKFFLCCHAAVYAAGGESINGRRKSKL